MITTALIKKYCIHLSLNKNFFNLKNLQSKKKNQIKIYCNSNLKHFE